MKVPKDYYQAEVRDGFYIPSEMKRCWAATIGVLNEIDKICKRHGLHYFAEYGTLLGAVRHGGFVPWDDDFDISMRRDDYMVFLKVARDELPEDYALLSVYNNPDYDNYLSRVVNSMFINVEQDFLEANHNFPFAVGVDIFPLDYFDYDENENDTLKELIVLAQSIVHYIDPKISDVNELDDTIKSIVDHFCELCGIPIENGRPIRQQIYIINERICSSFRSNSPYLSNLYFWVENGNQVYKKEVFENTIRIPFEFSHISVPIGYDEKLCNAYGPNYTTPYKGGGLHDYPCYDKQKQILLDIPENTLFVQYSFEPGDIDRPAVKAPVRTRREIVFLPFRPKYWAYMEKEWERAQQEDADVYVIPIPYFDKTTYGLNGDVHYETEGYPEYVPITPFDRYDFYSRIPDRIVIQNPYDGYDCAVTVYPTFYSDALRKITPELVYIPYFAIDDKNLEDEKTRYTADFFIKVPGVTRSDKVILPSEAVKQLYIDKLCEFAGEETKDVWNERLIVRDDILPEKAAGIAEEDIPKEWWKYLLDSHGEGKKVLLYHTSVSSIVSHGHRAIDKITRVLEQLREQRDVMTVIWQAHPQTHQVLESRYPELWKIYLEVLDRYITEDFGIYDESEDYSRAVAISDAYYGDRDSILHDFVQTGRPVMIANYEI